MEESVTAEVVEAIAQAEGRDPTDLDFSLQNYIDTDALRLLMEHKSSSWTLTFVVDDHEVVISGDGLVQVDSTHAQITDTPGKHRSGPGSAVGE